jgi:uncharacterized protein YaaN involved in tellurite resistance
VVFLNENNTGFSAVGTTATMPEEAAAQAANVAKVNNEELTAEEYAKAITLTNEIDIGNDEYTRSYGALIQAETGKFAREALGNTRAYEAGKETQKLVGSFKASVQEFKNLDPKGPFGKLRAKLNELKFWSERFQKITTIADKAEIGFKKQLTELSVDMKINEKAYGINARCRSDLLVHIFAGKQALVTARTKILAELKAKAEQSNSHGDLEAAGEYRKRCDEFELKLGRMDSSLAITFIRKPEIDLLRDSQRQSINMLQQLIDEGIPRWLYQVKTLIDAKHVANAQNTVDQARSAFEDLVMTSAQQVGAAAERTARNSEEPLIRTEKIIEATDVLLAALENVATANKEALESCRKHELEKAENNRRIAEHQRRALAG